MSGLPLGRQWFIRFTLFLLETHLSEAHARCALAEVLPELVVEPCRGSCTRSVGRTYNGPGSRVDRVTRSAKSAPEAFADPANEALLSAVSAGDVPPR
jgi:hypothetical protein